MEWAGELLKQGVLGIFATMEALAIVWLVKQLVASYEKRVVDATTMNDKYSQLGTKQNDTMKDLLNVTSQSQRSNEKAVDILQTLNNRK